MLIDLRANVLAVAQRMGHSDATVTLREYGHLFAGVQERLSEQLEELRARSASATSGDVVPLAVRDAAGRTQDAPGRKKQGQKRVSAVRCGAPKTLSDQGKRRLTSYPIDASGRVRFTPPPLPIAEQK